MIAGQSNAQGQAANLNGYYYHGVKAGLFRKITNDWVNLADPTDGIKGSVWPIVGQQFLNAVGTPIGFVPTAVSGSPSSSWLPGTTNYNNMVARANAAMVAGGTLRGVLWWQGEQDAIDQVDQATYHANLASIAGQIATDLGVPMFVCKIQRIGIFQAPEKQAPIDAAVEQAWSDVPNVRRGPDLSDLTADDVYHLVLEGKVEVAAARWWASIRTEFGW